MSTEEHKLTIATIQLLADAAHQRIGQVDGGTMGGEEQTIVDFLDCTDSTPLLHRELVTEGSHAFRLITLQNQSIGHAVGQRIAARHLRLAALLNLELCIVEPEVCCVALQSGW